MTGVFFNPHYFTPATGLVFALVMYGVRWLRARTGAFGPLVTFLFVVLVFATGLYHVVEASLENSKNRVPRQSIVAKLSTQGGRHLVNVRLRQFNGGRLDLLRLQVVQTVVDPNPAHNRLLA